MTLTLSHVTIAVTDLARSERFYSEALGFSRLYAAEPEDAFKRLLERTESGSLAMIAMQAGDFRIELLKIEPTEAVGAAGPRPAPPRRTGRRSPSRGGRHHARRRPSPARNRSRSGGRAVHDVRRPRRRSPAPDGAGAEPLLRISPMRPAFMKHFFQLGYVTPDLAAAQALYKERLGVSQFLSFDTAERNPGAPNPLNVGLAWTGETMIELIEPRDGDHPLYACAMPQSGFGIRLHHLGYLMYDRADYEEALGWLDAQRMPIVSHSKMEGMLELVYADARDLLGHHLEIIHMLPEGRAFFDSVPQN
jgi:catechol 2,3-dioxygenase-like lactoylglutathione lyase family enzyme